MARLAIGKGFLTEYGRLDKDVQSAVDAAIADFAKHPHPVSHLEKPQRSWDDRLRTLKVNSHWRGVVLAPATGDTYCLITILPQDKAKAYATTHRFSVNPALGVLEVRDEEAIKRLQPLLAETVKREDKRLFGDVSDADLTLLGIDAQLLPVIRLMTSEADLEPRQAALPEAQYAALHALACGMTVDEARKEVARLYSAEAPPGQVDPDDIVSAMERSPGQITFVSGHEELQLILAHPFAAWRMFLHPSQRKIAYRSSYSGPAQVTGGPGTGKTVALLHRAAFLAARTAAQPATAAQVEGQVLVTTFNGTLADALTDQLDLLVKDDEVRRRVEVLNVDRLAYRIVKAARGAPVIADERVLRAQWAQAAAAVGLDFPPAFLKNEWEQVILAQDLHTEQAYLTCLRTGRGRPLTKVQRSQVWQAAQLVTAELAAARQSTHMQLANEAAHLLRQSGAPRYRHILVDEAQDLHPSQWRLLRAAVAPGPDDLFIVADPHQRIYDNRVSLVSMRISVRGRSHRLSLSYRTTQEVLTWAISLLGTEPVTGLDGEVDSLIGYRSPMHGPPPRLRVAATRAEEFSHLAEQIRSWLAAGIEPQAIGVTARSASLVREAREALRASGIMTIPLSGRTSAPAVRAGTMHAMKGLEFQAVAVIGVEQGLVPEPTTITPEDDDPVAHGQDLQRERCLLFVACTRARDHLYVSCTGEPSAFLPAREPGPSPAGRDGDAPIRPGEPSGAAAKIGMRELLWSREDSWRPRLRSASLVAEAELRPEHTREVTAALGRLYAGLRHRRAEGDALLARWPACLVAAMAGVAATDRSGTYWPALWEAAGFQGTSEDEDIWGRAFVAAIGRLGMAMSPELPPHTAGAIFMHAGVPAYCLGDYFRLLLSRRRLDTGTDARGFLAWARAAGSGTVRSQLGESARQFLLGGGDYADDLVDRTLDLLDRLTEPAPDLDAVRLPGYMIEAAKEELAAGRLDLPWTGRHRAVTPQAAPDAREQDGWLLPPAGDEAPVHAEARAQPRLLLDDPLPGVATPGGLPVYPAPPRLRLPQDLGASIEWYAEVRRADGGSYARRVTGSADDTDLWEGVPRPVLGAFDVTVRGPLGRRLRRTVFVAEGLSVGYQPRVRPLTGAGLAAGAARLTADSAATVQPAVLRFGPRESTHVIEYRTDAAAEPLVVTPPHVAVACPGAGVTSWTTSQIHLVTEDFADAGRLFIRVPPSAQPGEGAAGGDAEQPELAVLVRGERVQVIEASGPQPPGLAGFELARAAGTIAACGRAELAVVMNGMLMPVGHVRPLRSAPGVESIFNGPCCSLHR